MNNPTPQDKPVSALILTWILMPLLMFFAAQGAFWFQHGTNNNELSAKDSTLVESKSAADTLFGRVEVIAIFSVVLVLAATRSKDIIAACRENPATAALPVFALCSAAWSQFPAQTLHFAPFLLGTTLFAFYLAKRFRPDQQSSLFEVFGWVSILFTCFLSIAMPKYGIDHTEGITAWQGLYGHKNSCALTTVFLLMPVLLRKSRGTLDNVNRFAYVALSLLIIVMSQSRTGWLVAICLLAFVPTYILITKFRARDRAPLILGVAAVSIVLGTLVIAFLPTILSALGKDPTLTGRTQIWKAVSISIAKRPVLGYGYEGFWHGIEGESANVAMAAGWVVPHAHNGLLEALVNLGIIGLGLVLIVLFQAFRNALICLRSSKSPSCVGWYLSFVVLIVLSNIGENTILLPISLQWAMYILACIGLTDQVKLVRAERLAHAQRLAHEEELVPAVAV
jgi:exopolysaccharide production protein ExoQ